MLDTGDNATMAVKRYASRRRRSRCKGEYAGAGAKQRVPDTTNQADCKSDEEPALDEGLLP